MVDLRDSIPSTGGRELGQALQEYVHKIPDGSAVVEVGAWLGAGTRQIAKALDARTTTHRLDLYGRFCATEAEVLRAANTGIHLRPGQNTIPVVRKHLRGIRQPITVHRGNLSRARWSGGPIGLYVDDAAKTEPLFRRMLHAFGPSWIPGKTIIVLMDHDHWREKGDAAVQQRFRFQHDFISDHPGCFTPVDRWEPCGLVSAAFRYTAPLDFSAIDPPREGWVSRASSLFRRTKHMHFDPGGL